MSYCVNCGVELDKTCAVCPLCNTAVYNPNQPVDTESPKPYAEQKENVELRSPREFTILMSIILGTISVVCGLLNLEFFDRTRWSFYVIGICAVVWFFLLPTFFPRKISTLTGLCLKGVSILAYLLMIHHLHPGNGWFIDIALPVTTIATLLVLNYYFFSLRRKSSFITKLTLLFASVGILCVTIELLADLHFYGIISFAWSLIVFACCSSLVVVLITISYLSGIRGELRKRLHF